MSSEANGPANQAGVSYQNRIAARWVAEMLSDPGLPGSQRIVSVQSEARADVDDVVVTYADGHRLFIQAKVNLAPSGDTWRSIWGDFKEQFARDDFRDKDSAQGKADSLNLWMGNDTANLAQWSSALQRTTGAPNFEEWRDSSLNEEQRKFWLNRVNPLLDSFATSELLAFLRCVRCDIHTEETLEAQTLRLLPRAFGEKGAITATDLLSFIHKRLPDDAAQRVTLTSSDLRDWLQLQHSVRLTSAPPLVELRAAIFRCSAVLRAQSHCFGEVGNPVIRHLERPVVADILTWLLPANLSPATPPDSAPEEQNNLSPDADLVEAQGSYVEDIIGSGNIAVLLESPGRGKTVVLHDVLAKLEGLKVPVLAIKADRQLNDLGERGVIHLCTGVDLPAPVEEVVEWLARAQTDGSPVVVLLDQVDALSLSMARDDAAIEAVATLVARLRGLPNVRVLLACRTFDFHGIPALRSLDIRTKFALPLLEESEVKRVLEDAAIDIGVLSHHTRKLLRVPLHLHLFLRTIEIESQIGVDGASVATPSIGDARSVRSLQQLYSLLWDRVILDSASSNVSVAHRIECMRALTDEMHKAQKTVAPANLFVSHALQHLAPAAHYLQRVGLITLGQGGWNFLHQTFFDYAFARFWVETGRGLSESILAGPQGLEERPLLSHVLGLLRATNSTAYYDELQKLGIATFFDHPQEEEQSLRKHLRILLREWFGSLSELLDNEWLWARRILVDPKLRILFLNHAGGNSAWFDRLLPQHLPAWMREFETNDNQLAEGDPNINDLCDAVWWMLRLQCDSVNNQDAILELLRPYIGRSDRWDRRSAVIAMQSKQWHSSAMVKFYGELLLRHWQDDWRLYYQLRSIARQRPLDACPIVRDVFALLIQEIDKLPPQPATHWANQKLAQVFSNFFSTGTGGSKINPEVLDPLVEQMPAEFVQCAWLLFESIMRFGLNIDPNAPIDAKISEKNAQFRALLVQNLQNSGEGVEGGIKEQDMGADADDEVIPITPFDPYFPKDACQEWWQMRTNRGSMFSEKWGITFGKALGAALNHLAEHQPAEFARWQPLLAAIPSETPQRLLVDGWRCNPAFYAEDALQFLLEDERRLELGEAAFETCRLIRDMMPYWDDAQCQQLESKILAHVVYHSQGSFSQYAGVEHWRLLPALESRLSVAAKERLHQMRAQFGPSANTEIPVTSGGGFIGSPIGEMEVNAFSDEDWLEAMAHYRGAVSHPDFWKGGAFQLSTIMGDRATKQPQRFARLWLEKVPLDVDEKYLDAALRALSDSLVLSKDVFAIVQRFIGRCQPQISRELSLTVTQIMESRASDGVPDDLLETLFTWTENPPYQLPEQIGEETDIIKDEDFRARQIDQALDAWRQVARMQSSEEATSEIDKKSSGGEEENNNAP